VYVSHFAQEHEANNGKPVESLVLAYETIHFSYVPRGTDNSLGSPIITGYDLSKATEL
jgi:type VI protein secretion system component Hcp